MSSPAEKPLSGEHQALLLSLARRSIEHGLQHRRELAVDPKSFPDALTEKRALFVTLHLGDELRGCVGTTEPNASLVENASRYAFYSAFRDSRFSEVTWEEYPDLALQISVLSLPEPMTFSSEENLIAQLRPGIDGVLLEAAGKRGTFLPSVWDMLPEPRDFWRQLKRKAGLPLDYYADTMSVSRYSTFCFSAGPV